MFDYAKREDLLQIKKLWMVCFGEKEASADFFLMQLFRPGNTLVWRDKGTVVSMMTLLEVTLEPNREKGSYIYAVATLPEYRRRGIMRAMDAYAGEIILQRGGHFACLIPAEQSLWSLYQRLGYNTSHWIIEKGEKAEKEVDYGFMNCEFKLFVELRTQYMETQLRWVQQSEHFLQYAYDEIKFYGGDIISFRDKGKLCYAVFSAFDQELTLRECSGSNPGAVARQLMRAHTLNHYKVIMPCSNGQPGSRPFAMAKALRGMSGLDINQLNDSYMGLFLD